MIFENLTCGYLGKKHENATLNSRFYAEMFSQNLSFREIILFPQRIPKSGFFQELVAHESPEFMKEFNDISSMIKKNAIASANKVSFEQSNSNLRELINWIYIMMRYGLSQEIITNKVYEIKIEPFNLEFETAKETAKIEVCLSSGATIDLTGLIQLSKQCLTQTNIPSREEIILLNRLVVYFYRHNQFSEYKNIILSFAQRLIDIIEHQSNDTFLNKIYASVVYRGLAMVIDMGKAFQQDCLDKSEQIARNIIGETVFEEISAKENLLTLLQTKSKWTMRNQDYKYTESCLLEMIDLDKHDSTGYSELGLFYSNNELYQDALPMFKKAIQLGPPAIGMNAYYYGKCLELSGNIEMAMTAFYEAAQLDEQSLSPWIDLFFIYINANQGYLAKKIAQHIFNTAILKEQLSDEEVIKIKSILC
ncbi:MAG TPA: hypothetical protein VG895_00125 [Patescibacteria group bacterium]|nr:hypothetical protein [Gammaproteobacteria bacterium]HWA51448.1 hypothetical protein [Patescibacteria group bacterium]